MIYEISNNINNKAYIVAKPIILITLQNVTTFVKLFENVISKHSNNLVHTPLSDLHVYFYNYSSYVVGSGVSVVNVQCIVILKISHSLLSRAITYCFFRTLFFFDFIKSTLDTLSKNEQVKIQSRGG